jgi:uncharacterized protein with HEPN domain
VLRHEYQRVDPDLLVKIAKENLPPLDRVCRSERLRQEPNEP